MVLRCFLSGGDREATAAAESEGGCCSGVSFVSQCFLFERTDVCCGGEGGRGSIVEEGSNAVSIRLNIINKASTRKETSALKKTSGICGTSRHEKWRQQIAGKSPVELLC